MQSYVPFTCKTLFFSLLLVFFAGYANCQDQSPQKFVEDLYKQIRSINLSKIAPQIQRVKIKKLMLDNIDFDTVAQFVLGKNLYSISEEEFLEFKIAYKKSVSKKYAKFLSGNNQQFTIISTDDLGKGRYLVNTKVMPEGARDDIQISYLVLQKDQEYKIIDTIIAGGISVATTDREEIAIFLETNKNTFDDLIKKLSV